MRYQFIFFFLAFPLFSYCQWTKVDGLPDSFQTQYLLVEEGSILAADSEVAWLSVDGGILWNLAGPGLRGPLSAAKHGGELWLSTHDTLWSTSGLGSPWKFYPVSSLSPGLLESHADKMVITSIDSTFLNVVELQPNGQLTVQQPQGPLGLTRLPP